MILIFRGSPLLSGGRTVPLLASKVFVNIYLRDPTQTEVRVTVLQTACTKCKVHSTLEMCTLTGAQAAMTQWEPRPAIVTLVMQCLESCFCILTSYAGRLLWWQSDSKSSLHVFRIAQIVKTVCVIPFMSYLQSCPICFQ